MQFLQKILQFFKRLIKAPNTSLELHHSDKIKLSSMNFPTRRTIWTSSQTFYDQFFEKPCKFSFFQFLLKCMILIELISLYKIALNYLSHKKVRIKLYNYLEDLKFLHDSLNVHFAFPIAKKRDTWKKRGAKASSPALPYYATPSGKPSTWLPLEGLVEQVPFNETTFWFKVEIKIFNFYIFLLSNINEISSFMLS